MGRCSNTTYIFILLNQIKKRLFASMWELNSDILRVFFMSQSLFSCFISLKVYQLAAHRWLLVKSCSSSSLLRNTSCMELFYCQSWIPLLCRVLQIYFDSCQPQALLKLCNFPPFSLDIHMFGSPPKNFDSSLFFFFTSFPDWVHLWSAQSLRAAAQTSSSAACGARSAQRLLRLCAEQLPLLHFLNLPPSTLHMFSFSLSSMCNPWLCHCLMDT